jgi:integrase/recombinase XerD
MLILTEKFLNHCKIENKSQNTINAYKRDLQLFVDYFQLTNENIINKLNNEVTLEKLYEFQGSRSNSSASTVARLTACIKSFYKFLHQFRYIKENVAVYLKQPKQGKRLPKFLNNKETVQLLNQVDKMNSRYPERDYAMLSIFVYTGIRVSELVNINVSDIHDGILRVIGKGNKERRISLNQECQKAINNYLKVKNVNSGDALFVSERGNRFQANPASLIVKKYLTAIGQEDMSVHKLRATFTTRLYNNGVDLFTLQSLLGHESLETTKRYTNVCDSNLKNAIENDKLD